MAVEPRRQCGFRSIGSTYLVSDDPGVRCERMPLPIVSCSRCGSGLKQTRGFQWVPHERLFDGLKGGMKTCKIVDRHCSTCPVCAPRLLANADPTDKVGMMWIGAQHYRTPEAFLEEAARLGVSRRVAVWPKGLVLGRSYVATAHPSALKPRGSTPAKPAVIHLFRVKRMELIVTKAMREEDWVSRLAARGATLVEVPENDPDHRPTAPRMTQRRQTRARLAQTEPKFSLFR